MKSWIRIRVRVKIWIKIRIKIKIQKLQRLKIESKRAEDAHEDWMLKMEP